MGKRRNQGYEMYRPKSGSSWSGKLSFKNFFRKYVYFRIQNDVKPYLQQFLMIFIIGLVLNYAYYQTLSLSYLFIGGVNQFFSVLMSTLNYGLGGSYDLFYLVINGIFYGYFYYYFSLMIYTTVINLEDRDTWVMLGWFVLILIVLDMFFPGVI